MRRGRKKAANKEKVFGCDLLEHLAACSQESKSLFHNNDTVHSVLMRSRLVQSDPDTKVVFIINYQYPLKVKSAIIHFHNI